MGRSPRIAIVSSGLGNVRRGNETGALTVAEALYADGADVTLFGGGSAVESECPYLSVRNLPRDAGALTSFLSWDRRYRLEQLTFEYFLRRPLVRGAFEIVHAADPDLALRLHRRSRELGVRVLYQNSQLLGPTWGAKFDYVQVLAPYYREIADQAGVDTRRWSVIPYLVDTRRFEPVDRPTVRAERSRRGVPEEATVLLSVGDLSKSSNKRLDWIVSEAASVRSTSPVHLVVLGQATNAELHSFRNFATEALGSSTQVIANVSAEEMPGWYRIADVLVHAALREPFGIVFLEAMASGVPIIAHPYAVTEWIVGPGGKLVDMTAKGALASAIEEVAASPEVNEDLGRAARMRAVQAFSAGQVVSLYREAYDRMMEG